MENRYPDIYCMENCFLPKIVHSDFITGDTLYGDVEWTAVQSPLIEYVNELSFYLAATT